MSDDQDFEEQLRQEKEAAEGDGGPRLRKDEDGTEYEWDAEKSAWFPKIDQDFIAQYQMTYGSDVASESTAESTVDTSSEAYRQWYNYYYGSTAAKTEDSEKQEGSTEDKTDKEIPPPPEDTNSEEYYNWYQKYYGTPSDTAAQHAQWAEYWQYYNQIGQDPSEGSNTANGKNTDTTDKAAKEGTQGGNSQEQAAADGKTKGTGKKRKPPEPPAWFDMAEDKNTNVYVRGLPPDMTDDEFKDLMNRCGLIMFDPVTRKPKLKLYKDSEGQNKGDGRCCYIKPESVGLALQFLDGSDVRGQTISVERAKFEMKGNFDPSKRRRKLTKQEKKKFQMKQEKLFDWRPDKPLGARNRNERVVVLKNAFDPKIFEEDPTKIKQVQQSLQKECSVFGEVKKVVVYDRHPEGVATVTFTQAEEADICIEGMNGRYYAQQLVTAETWDGKTKYIVKETEEEFNKRLQQWNRYLEEDPVPDGQPRSSEEPTVSSSAASDQRAADGRSESSDKPTVSDSVQTDQPEVSVSQSESSDQLSKPSDQPAVGGSVEQTSSESSDQMIVDEADHSDQAVVGDGQTSQSSDRLISDQGTA